MSVGDTIQLRKQLERFLECLGDNFLMQLLKKPPRKNSLLNLFSHKKELAGDMKAKISHGCSEDDKEQSLKS